ncbi:hypothetical protein DFH27DRAFT_604408 [Peziza echinospora]|nr:hypothetical protein DFH27DRAFT_604408 [Peziza echinospora]
MPPASCPSTPTRPMKVILVDFSPAATRTPGAPTNTPFPNIAGGWQALPANTKTALFVVGEDETELRRKNSQLVQKRLEGEERDLLTATISVAGDSMAFYLKWVQRETSMVGTHFAGLHREFPGARSLSAAEALGLISALSLSSNTGSNLVHNPSLKQMRWALQYISAHPHKFPGLNAEHLTQLSRYLLSGIDLTAPGAEAKFSAEEWTSSRSFATRVGSTLQTSNTWQQSTLVAACGNLLNPAWQQQEFKRYINHLKNSGKAVDYQEYMDLATKNAITESERDDLQLQVDTLKERLDKVVAENEQFRAENEQFRAENEQFRAENEQFRAENEQFREENRKLREENKELREEIGHLREENKELREEIGHLRALNEVQRVEIVELRASNEKLQATVAHLTTTVDNLEALIRSHLPTLVPQLPPR